LELLHELLPKVAVVGALANENNPNAEPQVRDLQAAAHALGTQLIVLDTGSEPEIDSAFATLPQRRIKALVATADGFSSVSRTTLLRWPLELRGLLDWQVGRLGALQDFYGGP
jgi:ABC-type uncharacterized transport system substrate-binding protein